MARIALALASGVVTLAAFGAVLRALDHRADRAHEREGAGTRAVAITTRVADTVLAAVLVA